MSKQLVEAMGRAYQEIQESKEKQKENNYIYAAKMAKKNGDKTFTIGGKEYDVEEALQKEDNTNDKSDDGDGLDKVQPKAVKKKFKDRKDQDIDNDGDVDSSDKFLHKRRKAVSKAIGEDEDEMNDDEKENGNGKENGDDKKKAKKKNGNGEKDEVEMNPKMESRIRKSLKSVLEANQSPNKDKAEKPEDALKGKGAKDMMAPAKNPEVDDTEEKGHDDASKAGKVTKAAGARGGRDNVRSGDQKVVAPGTAMKKTMEAYAQVQDKEKI